MNWTYAYVIVAVIVAVIIGLHIRARLIWKASRLTKEESARRVAEGSARLGGYGDKVPEFFTTSDFTTRSDVPGTKK